MGRVERYPNGTFCWVDLGTNDAKGAKAFYGGLFGWEFEDLPVGDQATYAICRLDGRAVAGLYDGAERPAWGSYIRVADADRATERARQLGAEVLVEPCDAPGGGRVATVRDPAGAEVSLSQSGEVFVAELVNQDGTWTWNELTSGDLAAGREFYVALFGWTAEDAPGPFPRTTFTLGALLIGGGTPPRRRRTRRRGGASRSGCRTPTGPRPRPRSWAGRCCSRPWTSRSAGSRSGPTPQGPSSSRRPCPADRSGA
ncbi:MAG TPA: VOC family protein, partial [Actinomycetota bacterium]|nr:VOC family protein [Actinomycetota bacterium]